LRLGAQESNSLQIYLERESMALTEELAVDITPATNQTNNFKPGGQRIAAGQRVDVYLIHLDTLGEEEIKGTYTIEFDRPILGVMTDYATLRATDTPCAAPGTAYRSQATIGKRVEGQGVDLLGLELSSGDSLEFSKDNRSLRLSLTSSSLMDQLRVIVLPHQDKTP